MLKTLQEIFLLKPIFAQKTLFENPKILCLQN